MKKVLFCMFFVLLLLFTACNFQYFDVPEISDKQITEITQAVTQASENVQPDDVWVYVSTGESGRDKPATIISVARNPNADIDALAREFASITDSLVDINFEIPFGHLVITYGDNASKNEPMFVYMTYDLSSCILTDYRSAKPVSNEFESIDALMNSYSEFVDA